MIRLPLAYGILICAGIFILFGGYLALKDTAGVAIIFGTLFMFAVLWAIAQVFDEGEP